MTFPTPTTERADVMYYVVKVDIPRDGAVTAIKTELYGPYTQWKAREVRNSILEESNDPSKITTATVKSLPVASGDRTN